MTVYTRELSIASKEARESHRWLRLLIASDIVQEDKIDHSLHRYTDSIFTLAVPLP
jgi:hypothetical protein